MTIPDAIIATSPLPAENVAPPPNAARSALSQRCGGLPARLFSALALASLSAAMLLLAQDRDSLSAHFNHKAGPDVQPAPSPSRPLPRPATITARSNDTHNSSVPSVDATRPLPRPQRTQADATTNTDLLHALPLPQTATALSYLSTPALPAGRQELAALLMGPHNGLPFSDALPVHYSWDDIAALMTEEDKAVPSIEVYEAISYASQHTGVDQLYLHRLAYAESTFRTTAHNNDGGGRGACGLFQFRTASTYLEAIYKHGDRFPAAYQHLAGTVERIVTPDVTSYEIKSGIDTDMVFDACYDPKFSSLLAAFFTEDLKNKIESNVPIDRPVNHAELYIAHFLGQNGGPRLLKAHVEESESPVSDFVSPAQEKANPAIFNKVSTVGEFYNYFVENKGMTDTPFTAGTPLPTIIAIPADTMPASNMTENDTAAQDAHNGTHYNVPRPLPRPARP